MSNPNHPKKHSRITVQPVQPIRDIKDIESIKKLLTGNTRDLLLFTMGINNGFRCGDLLNLKVGDVRDLKPGETLTVREQKTGKDNILNAFSRNYRAPSLTMNGLFPRQVTVNGISRHHMKQQGRNHFDPAPL